MRRFLIGSLLSILMVFCLSHIRYAEAQVKPDAEEKKAQEIANLYANTVLRVETKIIWDNGDEQEQMGSGFFIDNEGHLVTNCHVVREDKDTRYDILNDKIVKIVRYVYLVTCRNGTKVYKAEIRGWDKYRDVAILKVIDVDSRDIKPAALGNSNNLVVGNAVYAYGNPMGLTNTFTHGVVSALHRHLDLRFIEDFVQFDVATNPGSSGGPLINAKGEVVAITSAGIRGAEGLHFGVPINLLDVFRLKNLNGKGVEMGHLGADIMLDNFVRGGNPQGIHDLNVLNKKTGIEDLTLLKTISELTRENCALVLNVETDSPAEKAGLKIGDVVQSFNDRPVKTGRDIRILMGDMRIGKEFEIVILRVQNDGTAAELHLKATLDPEKTESGGPYPAKKKNFF